MIGSSDSTNRYLYLYWFLCVLVTAQKSVPFFVLGYFNESTDMHPCLYWLSCILMKIQNAYPHPYWFLRLLVVIHTGTRILSGSSASW